MSTSETGADAGTALREARRRLADAESAVAEHGEADLERVRDALTRAEGLLDRYEDSATGTGDFQAYVEFQGEFADLVEGLPDDLPARDAFEAANGTIDQRRLSESDFAAAREHLAPARELTDLLSDREQAGRAVREAERDVERRIAVLDDRIADRERVLELGDAFDAASEHAGADGNGGADVDQRVADLRETVETYDGSVRDAFADFRREASARELLGFVDDTAHYPLVEFETPPDELLAYVEDHEVGTEPLPDLLEYADYSASKLGHYVDDPGAFRTRVPVHRTYLDRLSADPLTVGWPAPPAGELRALAGELVSVVAKFADESVVADARELRRAVTRDDYDRLRRVAVAEADLTDEERGKLESGAIAEELEAARAERERLREALEDADTDGT
ncbi:hypothetical protein HUG10_12625 [Halorarum halophilum]|uniref:Uncharacterized protein n=1 Tax=Halorarum halophilum TaxID=2743090 RepID=A0A7D5KXJ6_9EURY|nr:hypothetical protein [Halobaculum halophilum]QLG28338.1 hypothetical protein HUG10_12625 [Halobaculum halophilum]